MEQAIRAISTEQGHDLRDFALIAFGGAAPVHAGRLAVELGISRVLIPLSPGVASAMGLLVSDVKRDYVRSNLALFCPEEIGRLNTIFGELTRQAINELIQEGFKENDIDLAHYLDMRYLGQGYEVIVPILQDDRLKEEDIALIRAQFDELHERRFGHRAEGQSVETVNLRIVASVKLPPLSLKRSEEALDRRSLEEAVKGHRPAYFGDTIGWTSCPVYTRDLLPAGCNLEGPAIIEQVDSTIIVHPGQSANVDAYKNVILSVGG
jgi:N-methylhydantoinase A